jgi:hypothetical protein
LAVRIKEDFNADKRFFHFFSIIFERRFQRVCLYEAVFAPNSGKFFLRRQLFLRPRAPEKNFDPLGYLPKLRLASFCFSLGRIVAHSRSFASRNFFIVRSSCAMFR